MNVSTRSLICERLPDVDVTGSGCKTRRNVLVNDARDGTRHSVASKLSKGKLSDNSRPRHPISFIVWLAGRPVGLNYVIWI